MLLNIILWIIFGALAGWVASLIMGTNEAHGAGTDIILGIIGAVVGGFLVSLLGGTGFTGFNIYGFVVAVIGAIVVIGLAKTLRHA